MRQITHDFISFWRLLILLCVTLQLPFVQAEEASETQLGQLKNRIGKLEQWLNSAKDEQTSLQQQLRQSEQQIGNIAGQLKNLISEIKLAQSNLNTLQNQHAKLLDDSQIQAHQIAAQVRAAYGIGHSEYLKVLLNLEQPAELARTLRYYDYFNRARAEQIEQYRQTARQLEENQSRINQQMIDLQSAREAMEAQHKALKDGKQQRHSVLLRLQNDISHKGKTLGKMQADRARLEKLLNSVEEVIADLAMPDATTPIQQLKGKLPWPTQGKIVQSFGTLDAKTGSHWNGILIRANEGNEVHAIHYGRVVFADWLRGFGQLLIIDHGNGYMSLYGHNQSLFKQTGDWVSSNDVISSVGNSGGKDIAGLYFEIRSNGKPQNPKSWILALK